MYKITTNRSGSVNIIFTRKVSEIEKKQVINEVAKYYNMPISTIVPA